MEKKICIMSECQFTRLAVLHFFDTVALNINSDAKLLIIDIRHDSSVIELASQLFLAVQKYPTRKCINIISNKSSITVNRSDLNVIYEDESLEEFIKKTNKVVNQKNYFSCAQLYLNTINSINLTAAQIKIAEEVASGLSSMQIAKKHRLSVKTIYTHISSIREKLQIETRHDLYLKLSKRKEFIKELKKHILQ
ncbi:helix-turn-helix transcriptional regulator [Pantoea sp. LS15]|uniref:helix-turn-helix transcriptional regulator n=1 Tax=Enterobacterales TaxID=91347 RepID=UPI00143B02BA|nr:MULTISPECIES: LuxR C-terminal-related transcriptional regulator [Enterobacterales]NJQ21787.1 helix-turn-helix transcriptional regulator [Pantoea sp. LS15]NKF48383.1 helix-turn-helix transcriptional regulator [Pantoea sp. LS15]